MGSVRDETDHEATMIMNRNRARLLSTMTLTLTALLAAHARLGAQVPDGGGAAPIEPLTAPAEVETHAETGAAATAPPTEASHPRVRVCGRVTDTAGTPLPGVIARLCSVGEPWVDPELEPEPFPPTRETTTDAEGRFVFEGPLPTSSWIDLSLVPSHHHAKAGRHFGHAGGRDLPPLHSGENDLGTFELESTGAISGLVRGPDGAGLPHAVVRLKDTYPGGRSVNTFTEINGTYLLGHVPDGTWTLGVSAEGFVDVELPGVAVRMNETTQGVDFDLGGAPRLFVGGRVVDEAGRPLGDVELYGWPVYGGKGAGAWSADDGSFRISLPQDARYVLEAGKPGFEPHDDAGTKGFAPGTLDIEIVLHPAHFEKFVVRDATTREPIARYALLIRRQEPPFAGSVSWRPGRLELQEHVGGEVSLVADPERDGFEAQAPGYASVSEFELPPADAEGHRDILLPREAVLVGRIVRGGKPVPHATLKYTPSGVVAADDGGRFRVAALRPGSYPFTVEVSGAATRKLPEMRIEAGQTVDLGDVELNAPAAIRGAVQLLPGAAADGVSVGLFSDGQRCGEATTDTAGRFIFTDLAAGGYKVWIREKPGIVLYSGPFLVELAEAEQRELVLDLSSSVPCSVRMRIHDAKPHAGFQVYWDGGPIPPHESDDFFGPPEGDPHGGYLGPSDAEGVVSGWMRPGPGTTFTVSTIGGLRPLARVASPAFTSQGQVTLDAEVRTGALQLEIAPPLMARAKHGCFSLRLEDPAIEDENACGVAIASTLGPWARDPDHPVFELLREGSWRLRISADLDGVWTTGFRDIEIIAGQTTRLALDALP